MKNHTICWLLLLAPFLCLSQGSKASNYNKFSSKQRVEADAVPILGLTGKNRLTLGLTSAGSSLVLTLSGAGWGTTTIDKDDELLLLFSNDSVVTLKSVSLQSFEPNVQQNTYRHQYAVSGNDLLFLSRYNLVGIRKYSFGSFADIEIPLENADKVKRMGSSFLLALSGNSAGRWVRQVSAGDIQKYIGDSIMFCSRVIGVQPGTGAEEGMVVLLLQAGTAGQPIQVAIASKASIQAAAGAERKFLNREVCISGVPVLRNNAPYLVVGRSEQITTTGTVGLNDINQYVGDSITVTGRVFTARYLPGLPDKPTIFYVREPFHPDQGLTLVIENKDRANFNRPEETFLNKTVRVSGRVLVDQRQYKMILRNSRQIEILPDNEVTPAITDSNLAGVNGQAAQPAKKPNPERSLMNADAEFPGGTDAFNLYIQQNLRHPQPFNEKEQKQVMASFEIDVDGNCRNVSIVQSAGPKFDREAKRVLEKMPRWTPAVRNGNAITSVLVHSIIFNGKK